MENSIDQTAEETNPFTEMWMGNLQGNLECHVYLARAQGFRAGVRPHTAPPIPGDEDNPPLTRDVFVEFPEKTVEWYFTDAVTDWLDSLPQYDH
jgi:hypothetical protein